MVDGPGIEPGEPSDSYLTIPAHNIKCDKVPRY